MTDVIIYRCNSCSKEFGPIGMHGYVPKEGNGELPVSCKQCGNIFVGKVVEKKLVDPNCPNCESPVKLFDGKCPSCGSREMIFKDVRMQGMERPAKAVKF